MNNHKLLLINKIFIVIMVFVISTCAAAETNTSTTTVSMDIRQMSGFTKFIIGGYLLYNGYIYRLESELSYPIDTLFAGARISTNSKNKWFTFYAGKNLTNPSNAMIDIDRLKYYTLVYDFSRTESRSMLDSFIVDTRMGWNIGSATDIKIDFTAGFLYQHFMFRLSGIDGWQIDSYDRKVYFNIYQDTLVLTYEINYMVPYVGFITRTLDFLDVNVFYSIFAKANDIDYHLLRNKRSESSCSGTLLTGEFGKSFKIGKNNGRFEWFAELWYKIDLFNLKGNQNQYWYGDDPISSINDTGSSINDIETEIISQQEAYNISAGFKF